MSIEFKQDDAIHALVRPARTELEKHLSGRLAVLSDGFNTDINNRVVDTQYHELTRRTCCNMWSEIERSIKMKAFWLLMCTNWLEIYDRDRIPLDK
jgi:hypothetical protein